MALADANRCDVESVRGRGVSLTLVTGWRSVAGKPIFGIEPVGTPESSPAPAGEALAPFLRGIAHSASEVPRVFGLRT
jgi:hypothetical protein